MGIFPVGALAFLAEDTPICLQRGNAEWGSTHIENRHGHWLKKNNVSAAEMVWLKCQHTGTIYTTERHDKYKINLILHPAALMVLRFIPGHSPYLRVLTIYNHQGTLDGQSLGRFIGRRWTGAGAKPTFALPVPAGVAITVRPKKRVLIKPE